MKYNTLNTPIICMQTESKCYKGTRPMTVRGVLWHSTGANNPNLSRYVQPADDDPNREQLLTLIGKNKYNNDYNHGSKDRSMGVNAWIGKLANGSVATVQAMPWAYAPWGCGGGSKGSCNDGWIQFETCESDLTNEMYAQAVYDEACELTAYLCTMYHLDPYGTVKFKGVDVPVILDHKESCRLGLGNNHGDVQHWFPKVLGKSLNDIRDDVAALMRGESSPVTAILKKGAKGDQVRELQSRLISLGYDLGKWGADGDFGNATVRAVMEFQQDHKIIASGIVDEATLMAIEEAQDAVGYTVTIRGLNAAQVAELQEQYVDCEVIKTEG